MKRHPGAPAFVLAALAVFATPGFAQDATVANPAPRAAPLLVEWRGRTFSARATPASVATFTWMP